MKLYYKKDKFELKLEGTAEEMLVYMRAKGNTSTFTNTLLSKKQPIKVISKEESDDDLIDVEIEKNSKI